MFVRPTFSLYAPFYHSSRGYGLAVDGTTARRLRPRAERSGDASALRFETGTAPESRAPAFYALRRPGARHHPRRVHRADRPPVRAARLGVPALALARRAAPRRRRPMLDGVADQRRRRRRRADVRAARHPGRRLPLRSPGAAPATSASPASSGTRRGCRTRTRCSPSLRAARLPHRHLERDLGVRRRAGRQRPRGAGARLPRARPGRRTPICADVGGSNFILDVTNPAARAWWRDTRRATSRAANGIRRHQARPRRGAHPVGGDATSGPTAATAARCATTTRRCRRRCTTTRWQRRIPTATSLLFTRSRLHRHAALRRSSGAATSPAARPSASAPAPTSACAAPSSASSAPPSWAIPIWGSDTGGYYQFKEREVFARWIEFSAFSGIMEIGGVGAHAPWDMPTDAGVRRGDDRHLPPLHAAARSACSRTSCAAARDAATRPADRAAAGVRRPHGPPRSRDRWDQYLFGPDLLVAPVWRVGQRARERLPARAGTWRSYWDATPASSTGPRTVTVDVPLDAIPVFVRDDAPSPLPPEYSSVG